LEDFAIKTGLYVFIGALMVLIGHHVANFRFSRRHSALLKEGYIWDVPAFIARRTGLYLAFFMGSCAITENLIAAYVKTGELSSMVSPSLLTESVLGLLSLVVFIFTALRSVDWIILNRINNDNAVISNNVAVGVTEGVILFATGLISYGSLLGEGHITTSWAFFVIGQVLFILIIAAMEHVIHPSHKAKTELEAGNLPSALIVCSMVISVAMFIKTGIAGDFTGYLADTIYLFEMLGIQLSMFFLYMFVVEPLLLMSMKLDDRQNITHVIVRSSLQILVAVTIVRATGII
jgi:multisubunit Na+/H+ antiporter MnhC subunit